MSNQENKQTPITPALGCNGGRIFASIARHILVGLRRWQRERAISELRRLDDRMLNDIGICRNDIPRVVDGLFSRPSKASTPSEPTVMKIRDDFVQLREAA